MKDRLDYSLSDKELFDVLGGSANVLTYPELEEFEDIDDVLGLNRRCILLYLTDEYYGHFTCMWVRKHKGKDILCFFDSCFALDTLVESNSNVVTLSTK